MRTWAITLLAACGGGGHGFGLGPDAATDGATGDAPPAAHAGGWRMTGRDASRTYRSNVAGPGAAAGSSVFAQNSAPDQYASLGTPAVDETGNTYFVSITPQQPTEIVSVDPTGHERWRVPVETGFSFYELDLGPDGNLYAVATNNTQTEQAKIVVLRASDGTTMPGSQMIPGLARILMPAAGGIYALTYTQAAGYGTEALDRVDHVRWQLAQGGDAYAMSPAGDTLAMMAVPASSTPLDLVAVSATDGSPKWQYQLAAGLATPALAIDTDGTVYAAASENGSNLHILKFSASGQLQWERIVSTLTWPSRILVGQQAIVIAAQDGQGYAGIGLDKVTGEPPAGSQLTCGEPQAIDSHDVVYWSCDNGQQATTPAGAFVASWPGAFTFQIVLGGGGEAYFVPAAYFADHQLFRIK